jgi:hypothetical protein
MDAYWSVSSSICQRRVQQYLRMKIPAIGTALAIGKVVGKVIRHFEDGFAVRFNEMQNLEGLGQKIVHNWTYEAAGAVREATAA